MWREGALPRRSATASGSPYGAERRGVPLLQRRWHVLQERTQCTLSGQRLDEMHDAVDDQSKCETAVDDTFDRRNRTHLTEDGVCLEREDDDQTDQKSHIAKAAP